MTQGRVLEFLSTADESNKFQKSLKRKFIKALHGKYLPYLMTNDKPLNWHIYTLHIQVKYANMSIQIPLNSSRSHGHYALKSI